jgi:uncharacterized protein YecT (DUF1311 family)
MTRLNADPKFVAKRRAAQRAWMKRSNADPAFAAKQRASVSIPPKTRAAIIAALKVDPHARAVQRSILAQGGGSEMQHTAAIVHPAAR